MAAMIASSAAVQAAVMPPTPFILQGNEIYELNDNAILDATVAAGQSSFSGNFAIEGNPRGAGSGSTSLSLVPFVDDKTFMELNFDSQQNNSAAGTELRLDTIRILIDGDLIWSLNGMTAPIILNAPGAVQTASPNANSRDLRLLVPTFAIQVAAWTNNKTYTGNSTLTLEWTQSNSTGSPDEWELQTCDPAFNFCFQGADIIGDPDIVPLPAALPLFATAIAGLVWMRRRRAAAG